ncbi:hypothetical protein DFH09DRAFT_1083270 [Mycena vulgaris]|nr:hypothetical protein DFH09DRAFT_1083270 [Mycena vulgaris]
MAITETQKSRTTRARDKNPPQLTKPHAKPGPKFKNGPRTAARFEKNDRRQEFKFSKKEALDAVTFLQKIAHHGPDLDVALPLAGHLNKFRSALAQEIEEAKVQTSITSFLK